MLSTLGKLLESVVAERLSYVAATYGLFPANHFGPRKPRSAEQAPMLLQEQIVYAWRAIRVLSLVSFDVKGASNGVCSDRLAQRMKARGVPETWTRAGWKLSPPRARPPSMSMGRRLPARNCRRPDKELFLSGR